jgi:alpha-1,2-mannosyltransferase
MSKAAPHIRAANADKFLFNFAIFALVNILSAFFGHIDDTDETFGYWEPLHYLLFGTGMQTWEYAPEYAIRTYAFISPFWCFGTLLKLIGLPKVLIFYCIRLLLGTSAAYAEASLIDGIDFRFGPSLARYSFLFTLFSPGILYASTSFLPSAVSMTLVLLANAAWMKRDYNSTIFYGCICVLWTGWPFVGVVFLPLGVHMLWSTYTSAENKFNKIALLLGAGLCILISSILGAAIIDVLMYQRM